MSSPEGRRPLPLRGTYLNTATVVAGSILGLWFGALLPADLQEVALIGIGLVTVGLGVKMFLRSENVLIVTIAIVIGGMLGRLMGVDVFLSGLGDRVQEMIGASGTFSEGLIAASILYCVGPMTILGCLQDGLERKIELLSVKSVLDGIASVFLAAALGLGVLFSAAVVLVVQGGLTLAAQPLEPVMKKGSVIAELSAAGGCIMMVIGLRFLGFGHLKPELFLPALILAPLISLVPWHRITERAGKGKVS